MPDRKTTKEIKETMYEDEKNIAPELSQHFTFQYIVCGYFCAIPLVKDRKRSQKPILLNFIHTSYVGRI